MAEAFEQGRQGRRHHRRGRQEPRDDRRRRRGHAVRPRLPLARTSSPTPTTMDVRAGEAAHPHPRGQDLQRHQAGAAAREGRQGQAAAADHRRGRRGRGPGDAGGQQAPRHPERVRRQGPRLRRPPQGHAGGHRHPDRRQADHQGPGHRAGRASPSPTSARPRRSPSTTTTRRSSKAPAASTAIQGRIEQIRSEIETTTSDYDREKLQERLAKLAGGVAQINVGAATESRDEGEEGPHRGRPARDPRGHRGRHRPRRRRGPGPLHRGARQAQAQRRRDDRRRHRPSRAMPSPCDRSPTTPARRPAWSSARSPRARAPSATTPTTDKYDDLRQGRRHRPGQGHPHRPAERRQRRAACC